MNPPFEPRPAGRVQWAFSLGRVSPQLLALLTGLMPALATLLLVRFHLQASFTDFVPNTWNDQTYYWHQIYTFSQVGFAGGYYSFYEKTAAIPLFHFGASGPVFPVLYGLIARITGWQMVTGLAINLAILTLAVWGFIAGLRLNRRQILLTGIALLALGPVLMFLPAISQETLHQAAALALAVIFARLLAPDSQPLPRRWYWSALGFILLIALLRFSWALLLLPFFLLSENHLTLKRAAWALVKTAALTSLVLVIFQASGAPGNNSIFLRLASLYTDPIRGTTYLLDLIQSNLRGSFMTLLDAGQMTSDHAQGMQFWLLVGVALVGCAGGRATRREMLFHSYNLLSILTLALIFYLPGGFYRVFAPHLLLTVLLLIVCRRWLPVAVFVIVGVFTLGSFFSDYHRNWYASFHPDRTLIVPVRDTFGQHLLYQTDAANPWCNTVLFPLYWLDYRVTLIPAGIGITYFEVFDQLDLPVKSHYLLLDEASYAEAQDRLHVERLAATPLGTIYRNLDAVCDLPQSRLARTKHASFSD